MAFSDNNIIVFTDLLESEEQCVADLKQDATLAKMMDAKIYLISINSASIPDAESKLKKIADTASAEIGIPILTEAIKSKEHKEIVKFADKIEPELAVIDSKLFYAIENSHKLARKLSCPLLILKDKRIQFKNIILPLDLTKESREKVTNAITFAKHFGSTVKVLAVRTEDELPYENKLISYTHQVKNYIKEKGIESTIKTLAGEDVVKLVIDYCTVKEGDLLMIINDPEVGLVEMFKGTQAQKIIDQSEIPVLSVPPVRRRDTSQSVTPY